MLPFIIPLTYFFVLLPPSDYTEIVGDGISWTNSGSEYMALPEEEVESEGTVPVGAVPTAASLPGLSSADKWRLVRPLLMKYMLPLCKLLLSLRYRIYF